MNKVYKIDRVEIRVDEVIGEHYYGVCPECYKKLNGDEMAYGHDCEE